MLKQAIQTLHQGGVIAYPTESVFGLGCDPFNEAAVKRLLALKHRSQEKGLILIAAAWEQVSSLAEALPQEKMQNIFETWPGPVTWVFPVKNDVPVWLSGKYKSLAIRVTAHPIAKEICTLFQGPIVSTSANVEARAPAKTAEEVYQIFGEKVDFIVSGEVGSLEKPTQIRDAANGKILRV